MLKKSWLEVSLNVDGELAEAVAEVLRRFTPDGVVIESTDYKLTLSAPEWRLTPEEDAERARQAAAGMAGFMGKLTEAIEQHQHGQKDPEEEWDEHDYEKFMKECDARTDKYMELQEKYG